MRMKLNRQAVDKNDKLSRCLIKLRSAPRHFVPTPVGVKTVHPSSNGTTAVKSVLLPKLPCKPCIERARGSTANWEDATFLEPPVLGVARNRCRRERRPLMEKYQAEFCDRHRTTDDMHTRAHAASRKMGQEDGAPEGFEMPKRGCVETSSSPETAGT